MSSRHVFILKRDTSSKDSTDELDIIEFSHSRTSEKNKFLVRNGMIMEINVLKAPHQAWLAGNSVIQGGKLYLATPIDPLFIILPLLDENWFNSEPSGNKMYKTLDELLPSRLLSIPKLNKIVETVCDIKVLDMEPDEASHYFRLSEEKLIRWLCKKHELLSNHLKTSDSEYSINSFMIISDYLPNRWSRKFQSALGIQEADIQASTKSSQKIAAVSSIISPDQFINEQKEMKLESSKKPKTKAAAAPPKGMRSLDSYFKKAK